MLARVSTKQRGPDLPQIIAAIKDAYGVNESEIARRIGVAPATVNAWVHRTRGTGRGPNRETLRALAREFPKFTEEEIFAAAGRKAPGPASPDAEERILELYRSLTREQQEFTETTLRVLKQQNESRLS